MIKFIWHKYRKVAFGTLMAVDLFLMLGTVGSMDLETVTLSQGTIRLVIYMILFCLLGWRAGLFKQ